MLIKYKVKGRSYLGGFSVIEQCSNYGRVQFPAESVGVGKWTEA